MAKRTIYATIRIDLQADVEEITDEMVQAFEGNSLYEIPSADVMLDDKTIIPLNVTDTIWEETKY